MERIQKMWGEAIGAWGGLEAKRLWGVVRGAATWDGGAWGRRDLSRKCCGQINGCWGHRARIGPQAWRHTIYQK